MILSIESSCDDSSLALTRIEDAQLIAHFKISKKSTTALMGALCLSLHRACMLRICRFY